MAMLKLLSRSVSSGSLASVAAALVLAGIAADAQAYGDKGVLRLQLGAFNQFAYFYAGSATPVPDDVQRFYAGSKGSCRLVWETSDHELAKLTADPVVDGDSRPGFGSTSIGVYDGPKGTPCSRVSTYANESLTFALGAYTRGPIGANAFDRLELDIEVKGDAEVWLTTHLVNPTTGAKLDWVLETYKLRSGSSIIPGDPEPNVFNCSARSDSGPDSGPNDNCRWIIDGAGQAFTIKPVHGEFSLEGGGDFAGDAYDNNTLIYLTNMVVGELACGGTTPTIDIDDGIEGAQCEVASPPQVPGQDCGIFYAFRDITGDTKGCEFIKGPGQQLVASMTITFPAEPRTTLYEMPPTFFEFPGATELFPADVCTGSLIDEDGAGNPVNPTIDMSTLPVNDGNDAVVGNGLIDWACILEQTIEYLGDEEMQVRQNLLFWGDPAAIRF